MDKTLTPSPWTTLKDYPNMEWTTCLKWTTSKNAISDYILTIHDLYGLQLPFSIIISNKTAVNKKGEDSNQFEKALEMNCT